MLDSKELHFREKPKGKWKCVKPDEWTRPFVFGHSAREPFEETDYDVVEQLKDLGFKIEQLEGSPVIDLDTVEEQDMSPNPAVAPHTAHVATKRGR